MLRKLFRITTVSISLDKLLPGQLKFMSEYYDVVGMSSGSELLEQVGKREGVRTIDIHLTRKITPVEDLRSLWKLYKILKKEKPFIVHTHTPKAGTVGLMAAKLAGVPHRLHTVAGLPLLEATGKKRKLLNAVEKMTYACATKVYPNSFGLRDIIVEQKFCHPNKLKVIGHGSSNGINTKKFSREHFSEQYRLDLRKERNIQPDDFLFIFVGRLVADKGINELVAAFKRIGQPNIKLLLVGPLEQDLDPLQPETLKEIEQNPQIISVGYQSDVRPYFFISDALVFPSYREGFPNVVMQAGAMELPSIVTNINGCNEIIKPGENGLIIPPKQEEPLYHAMQQLSQDKELHKKLKNNARQIISSRYDQQYLWQELLNEYKSLDTNH